MSSQEAAEIGGRRTENEGDMSLDEAVRSDSFSPEQDGLSQGHASQTGRIDVADSGMGTGVAPGTGTASRGPSDSTGPRDRDVEADSNLRDSDDPLGARGYPNQVGGTPVDRHALTPEEDAPPA